MRPLWAAGWTGITHERIARVRSPGRLELPRRPYHPASARKPPGDAEYGTDVDGGLR